MGWKGGDASNWGCKLDLVPFKQTVYVCGSLSDCECESLKKVLQSPRLLCLHASNRTSLFAPINSVFFIVWKRLNFIQLAVSECVLSISGEIWSAPACISVCVCVYWNALVCVCLGIRYEWNAAGLGNNVLHCHKTWIHTFRAASSALYRGPR